MKPHINIQILFFFLKKKKGEMVKGEKSKTITQVIS